MVLVVLMPEFEGFEIPWNQVGRETENYCQRKIPRFATTRPRDPGPINAYTGDDEGTIFQRTVVVL